MIVCVVVVRVFALEIMRLAVMTMCIVVVPIMLVPVVIMLLLGKSSDDGRVGTGVLCQPGVVPAPFPTTTSASLIFAISLAEGL